MSSPSTVTFMTFIATQAALKAGDILRKGYGSVFEIHSKPGKQNIVTEFDKASELSIINLIMDHFPNHSVLAEESGHTEKKEADITWIIDPLDGTTNFAHHLPCFTISIAAYRGEEGLCAVIYQPLTNELFIAEKGIGAYLNGVNLAVSQTTKMDETLVGIGVPWGAVENPTPYIERESRFAQLGVNVRNFGSAALALAYVAAGKLDGFWMDYLFPWDSAAGKLLIQEAGGRFTCYDGKEHSIFIPSNVLATNGIIHREMVQHLKY